MKHEALARLYPNLSEDELQEAKENLDLYLLLAWEIWEEEQAAAQSTLTQDDPSFTIKAKVDFPKK
jgi:hypothetical protein